jgi:hypothetical protein
VTSTIRQGVADAFGWPMDWPEQVVVSEPAGLGLILERIQAGMEAAATDRRDLHVKLDAILDELRQHRQLVEPTADVEALLERLTVAVTAATCAPTRVARTAPRAG